MCLHLYKGNESYKYFCNPFAISHRSQHATSSDEVWKSKLHLKSFSVLQQHWEQEVRQREEKRRNMKCSMDVIWRSCCGLFKAQSQLSESTQEKQDKTTPPTQTLIKLLAHRHTVWKGNFSSDENKLFCTDWAEARSYRPKKLLSNQIITWDCERETRSRSCLLMSFTHTRGLDHRFVSYEAYVKSEEKSWYITCRHSSIIKHWLSKRENRCCISHRPKLSRLCWTPYVFEWVVSGWGCGWGGWQYVCVRCFFFCVCIS